MVTLATPNSGAMLHGQISEAALLKPGHAFFLDEQSRICH